MGGQARIDLAERVEPDSEQQEEERRTIASNQGRVLLLIERKRLMVMSGPVMQRRYHNIYEELSMALNQLLPTDQRSTDPDQYPE